ncbi:MAG: pitrilysin family protein [Alphaproteobacteria bacterium]
MGVRVTTLANGLRIVSDRMDRVETAALGVWVATGTRNEEADVNGVSHLLEHMAFKGTARRTARGIAEEIEAVGGSINAHTSREHTAYYVQVLKDDLALGVDILADILQNSVFDPAELERERAVVLQEIGQARDTPDDIIFDNFQDAAYRGQPLGRSVLGTEDRVRAMGRDAVIGYLHRHYVAPAMVVSAAGHVDHDRLVALVDQAFGGLSAAPALLPEPARYVGGEHREDRDLEQVHLVLGFPGVSFTDPDFDALGGLSMILGGGMSSRLFQEIRETRGLVYSIYSFASSFCDGGTLAIYAGTGEAEVAELVPVLCNELVAVTQGSVDADLGRVKAQLKAGTVMALESSAARCEQLARQMLIWNRPIPIDEIMSRIQAVDSRAICRVAERTLGGRPTLAAIGPLARLEPLDQIARRLAL